MPPREEASVQYSFTPNKAIVPREFFVALTAFYTNAAGQVRRAQGGCTGSGQYGCSDSAKRWAS